LIIQDLQTRGHKPTNIAKSIGYTTTTILNNVLKGKSLLTSRTIEKLIEKYNVNPIFIFLGKSDMYLTADSEVEQMRKRIQQLELEKLYTEDTLREYKNEIKRLEKRNDDLIDLTTAAIKYYRKDEDSGSDPYERMGR
jgi:plasmid maintenance system antidote protein VapI